MCLVAAAVSKGQAHDNPASGGRPHLTETQWELLQSAVDKDRMRKVGWKQTSKALAMPRICFLPFSSFNIYTYRSGRKIKAGMGDYYTV